MGLKNISPIDGRYEQKTSALKEYFSEFGLIRYRVFVEWSYLRALKTALPQVFQGIDDEYLENMQLGALKLSLSDAEEIKKIEKITNHDVKAVEYFVKSQLDKDGYETYKEWVHFALTSQDINNTAIPISIKRALEDVYQPLLLNLMETIFKLAKDWAEIPMLARTHGQPASPTTVGNEFYVFYYRLKEMSEELSNYRMSCKFGGATGNFNAHHVCFPDIDWAQFADGFCSNYLGLERQSVSTQIDNYDRLSALFHLLSRINTCLIDFCRDLWSYISIEYFKQKTVAGEIGSSAMPHKVNPIDFENAEGNLGMANAIFEHLASKLPISRWQRDLTDSTVLRNVGVPLGHGLIAIKALLKGLGKIELNQEAIQSDLDQNPMVLAEAIQNILRTVQYPKPYEALKELTRGKHSVTLEDIHEFISQLDVDEELKSRLKSLKPEDYTGMPNPMPK